MKTDDAASRGPLVPRPLLALNVLLLVCPTILLREFVRRFEFARFNMFGAFLFDMGIAALVLTILSILAYTSLLSGATGLLAVGSACGLAGAAWWCIWTRNLWGAC